MTAASPTPDLTSAPAPERSPCALRLDHIGIAVRSIAAARAVYESLGLAVTHEETIDHEHIHVAILSLNDICIELLEPALLEPASTESAIARFLAKRGPGLHHIALRLDPATDGIDALFFRLRCQGVRLASDSIRTGAEGHRYFFIHPKSTGGLLLEIVEAKSV